LVTHVYTLTHFNTHTHTHTHTHTQVVGSERESAGEERRAVLLSNSQGAAPHLHRILHRASALRSVDAYLHQLLPPASSASQPPCIACSLDLVERMCCTLVCCTPLVLALYTRVHTGHPLKGSRVGGRYRKFGLCNDHLDLSLASLEQVPQCVRFEY
jgi:hypothetical protein